MTEHITEPPRELDYGQAVVFLEKAVAEKGPDFTYHTRELNEHERATWYASDDMVEEGCLYFDNGQPSCIVGHVLSYMGYDNAPEGAPAQIALTTLGIAMDDETRRLLTDVQRRQDNGIPWGEAVNKSLGLE